MEKEIISWVIWHSVESDWLAWDLGITKDMIPKITKWRRLALFNQSKLKETTSACTIVNAYREYCYQTGNGFSQDELLDIIEYAKKNMWYTWWGWYSSSWMNAVRKYFNKESFVLVSYNDILLWEIYINNNSVGITYKWNSIWNSDSDDWILDWLSFGETTYSHRTSTVFYEWLNIVVDDSYAWSKWNIYQIPNLIKLVKKWYIYPTFYLWIPLNNTWRISELNKFKLSCENAIKWLQERKLFTKDSNYLSYLNNSIIKEIKKLEDIKEQLLLLPK